MPSRGHPAESGIRLDVFLKRAGLLKRRSLARTFCEAGAVSVNGQPVKSSKWIQAGDRIQIDSWNRHLLLLVRSIPNKGPRPEGKCYEVLEEERKPPETDIPRVEP
ncbi:MAG: S4 domain-containing protein [Nitrospinota bacterium]